MKLALESLEALAVKLKDTASRDLVTGIQNDSTTLIQKKVIGKDSPEQITREERRIANAAVTLLSQIERETHKLEKEIQPQNDVPRNEYIEGAKAAIILVELEKIKYKYHTSALHLRRDLLEDLRVYKAITTEVTTIEIYSFLVEVADLLDYPNAMGFGGNIHSLLVYFFPDSEEDRKYIDLIISKCIDIGSFLLMRSVFKQKDFKDGVSGLSILKWIELKGKRLEDEAVGLKIRATYDRVKGLLNGEISTLENGKAKLRIIETFEEDLNVDGLRFPDFPDDLFFLI